MVRAVQPRQEGRIAIVTNVGLDAMDAVLTLCEGVEGTLLTAQPAGPATLLRFQHRAETV